MSTLTAFYDLAVGPVSFDFLVFAVKAEMQRRRIGASRLHIVIVPFAAGVGGMFRDKRHLYDEHEMRWRLWNICLPSCHLLGASVTLATSWEQAKLLIPDARRQTPDASVWPEDWNKQTLKDRRHLIGDIIAWSNGGAEVPVLKASEHARRKVREAWAARTTPSPSGPPLLVKEGKGVVTMTFRQTYLPERNSNPADWNAAARHIEAHGYVVVVLQDTNTALAAGQGYGELNLDVRMACYEAAALNLQANNGAASLCWFSDRPYRMFGAGVPADEWDGLFVKQGLPLGATWPWAKPQQKIVYGPTTAEQIVNEFDDWRTQHSALSTQH